MAFPIIVNLNNLFPLPAAPAPVVVNTRGATYAKLMMFAALLFALPAWDESSFCESLRKREDKALRKYKRDSLIGYKDIHDSVTEYSKLENAYILANRAEKDKHNCLKAGKNIIPGIGCGGLVELFEDAVAYKNRTDKTYTYAQKKADDSWHKASISLNRYVSRKDKRAGHYCWQ